MRQLLEWGADPNTRTSEGCTALHYAAYMGQPECVRTLLRVGGEPSILSQRSEWSQRHSNYSRLPLDYALEQYSCDDQQCVCHQQTPDQEKKALCAAELQAWNCRMRSLQSLSRAEVRRNVSPDADLHKAVQAMPISDTLARYVMFEEELDVQRREREVDFRMKRSSRMGRREHV